MQVTIQEAARKEFSLKPGSRLTRTAQNNARGGRRVRNVNELAGCLKSKTAFPGIKEEKQAVAELRAKDCAKNHGQK
jgi:hypothetical protein